MIFAMILSWVVFGFVVGAIARAIFPGTQSMGFVGTAMLGVFGSLCGGLLGNVVVGAPMLTFHGAGLIGSVLGALVVMAVLGATTRHAHA
jgi:uncharacterized membrane protein YeaQ/YmgE (transglycosylase-associated protein family)